MKEVLNAIRCASEALGMADGRISIEEFRGRGRSSMLVINDWWRVEWIVAPDERGGGHYLLWHPGEGARTVRVARSGSAEGIVRQLFRVLVDERLERAFATRPTLALVTAEGGGE